MDLLVSPSWLATRLQQPHVAVLDASLPPVGVEPVPDVKLRYRQGHIPGAVFFDIEALSDQATTLPHMLPAPESFSRSMGALGIADTMTLVVYEQEGVFSAPRAWWMLRSMGATEVYVLDGGLRAWLDAGYAAEAGVPVRPHATFAATLQPNAVRGLTEIQALAAGSERTEQVLDARSAARFAGAAPEPRPGLPSGHMPGSINVPYTELVREGRLADPARLRSVFEAHGVDLARPITTTCGSGITAAVLALALECCGVPHVKLYDGSWAEYARDPQSPVLRGS